MDIDLTQVIIWLLGAITTVLGWLIRMLWSALRSHNQRIDILEKDMAVQETKLEIQEETARTLRDVLTAIDDKLDKVAECSARTTAILERLPCSTGDKCSK